MKSINNDVEPFVRMLVTAAFCQGRGEGGGGKRESEEKEGRNKPVQSGSEAHCACKLRLFKSRL
jgi:hypothetical protein